MHQYRSSIFRIWKLSLLNKLFRCCSHKRKFQFLRPERHVIRCRLNCTMRQHNSPVTSKSKPCFLTSGLEFALICFLASVCVYFYFPLWRVELGRQIMTHILFEFIARNEGQVNQMHENTSWRMHQIQSSHGYIAGLLVLRGIFSGYSRESEIFSPFAWVCAA